MPEKQVHSRDDLLNIIAGIKIANSFTHAMPKLSWQVEPIPLGYLLNYCYERPDTFTGEVSHGRGRKEFIPMGSTESYVVKTCWLLLELLVRHELMEAFQYKGVRVFNPHHSVEDLVKAATSWWDRAVEDGTVV